MLHDFFLTEWFFYAVRWLYGVLGNSYFLTIFVTTLILRLIQIYPDIKSRKTQQKQAALQPKIDALKKKYADNPQKLQQEQQKLMKENGIGCLAGCLPMLLTLPLFFCFLAAFRFWGYEQNIKLTYETIVSENTAQESAAEAETDRAQQTFDSYRFLWITNIWQPDSGFAPVITPAKTVSTYGNGNGCSCAGKSNIGNLVILQNGYTDDNGNYISGEDIWNAFLDNGLASGKYVKDGETAEEGSEMQLLKTEDSQKKYAELMKRYDKGYNNGWFILPILATAFQFLLSWLGQRQSKKANPAAAAAPQGMNMMMYMFPVMSLIFCLQSTSAFALYWVLSSVFQMISSTLISHFTYKKAQSNGEITVE